MEQRTGAPQRDTGRRTEPDGILVKQGSVVETTCLPLAHQPYSMISPVDDKVIPIWNTLGVIPGHIKDEVVVVGNHRDGT